MLDSTGAVVVKYAYDAMVEAGIINIFKSLQKTIEYTIYMGFFVN